MRTAAPLLLLISSLHCDQRTDDAAGLRDQLMLELRAFETRARASAVPAEHTAAARYVLCATLDEAILATAWGQRNGWQRCSLLANVRDDSTPGERFFLILERALCDTRQYAGLIEVIYCCLCLGFAGKFAAETDGSGKLKELRLRLLQKLRILRNITTDELLAPHWQSAIAGSAASRWLVPVWVVAAGAIALLSGVYDHFRTRLNRDSSEPLAVLSATGIPGYVSEVPERTRTRGLSLGNLLSDLDRTGLVSVDEVGGRSILTISREDLIPPGNPDVGVGLAAVLDRVAGALARSPGPVFVIGHEDAGQSRSLRFENAFEISEVRAANVARYLQGRRIAASRLQFTGVGSAQPRTVTSPDGTDPGYCSLEIVHFAVADDTT